MTKEEQSIPPAVIATRAKKGLAIATGNPLDKIELNPKEVDKKQIQTEQTLIERVVSLMQRRKRALQMKRRKPRIVRARNIKKTRLATQDQLMRRAMRMAKTLLRKRAAGARGTSYNKLSSAQKLNIDRQIEPRTKNIKAMATRLMPRVKAGEMKRLNAVRSHKSTKGVYGNIQNLTQSYQPVFYSKLLGEKVSVEDLNIMFSMYEGKIISALTSPIRAAAKVAGATAATTLALSSPAATAAALTGAIGYGYKKVSEFGKADPDKEKKAKDDKHSEAMKTNQQKIAQQALIQSKEKSKQAQLTTKQMQSKMANKNKPSIAPATQPTSRAQPTTPAAQPTPKPATVAQATPTAQPANQSSIIIPQPSRARTQQMQQNLAPAPKTLSQIRQQKQSTAAKAARQQMGLVNHMELEDGTPLSESFVVDRAVGYSGVYTAKDLGIKIQGGFALHPSVEEDYGAGFEGTNKLTNKYKKDTPGEAVEAFARMLRAKRKANTPC